VAVIGESSLQGQEGRGSFRSFAGNSDAAEPCKGLETEENTRGTIGGGKEENGDCDLLAGIRSKLRWKCNLRWLMNKTFRRSVDHFPFKGDYCGLEGGKNPLSPSPILSRPVRADEGPVKTALPRLQREDSTDFVCVDDPHGAYRPPPSLERGGEREERKHAATGDCAKNARRRRRPPKKRESVFSGLRSWGPETSMQPEESHEQSNGRRGGGGEGGQPNGGILALPGTSGNCEYRAQSFDGPGPILRGRSWLGEDL